MSGFLKSGALYRFKHRNYSARLFLVRLEGNTVRLDSGAYTPESEPFMYLGRFKGRHSGNYAVPSELETFLYHRNLVCLVTRSDANPQDFLNLVIGS